MGLDFLALFRSFRAGILDSTPQLLVRDRRAVAPGAQLSPGDFLMDAAAVGPGDDILSASDFSECARSPRSGVGISMVFGC